MSGIKKRLPLFITIGVLIVAAAVVGVLFLTGVLSFKTPEKIQGPHIKSIVATDNDGKTLSAVYYTYDEYGRQITETNFEGETQQNKATYSYNRDNQQIKKELDSGISTIITEYKYDKKGNLIKEITDTGSYYIYKYNGKLLQKKTLKSKAKKTIRSIVYKYDKNGNKIKETTFDAKGSESSYIEFEYDEYNEIVREKNYEDGEEINDKIYIYDEDGVLMSTKSHNLEAENYESCSYQYNKNGTVNKEIYYMNDTEGKSDITGTVTYTYGD